MSPLAVPQAHIKYDATMEARLALTEALGTVAHELRQPLSNIEAIAYYLGMILPPGDAKVQAQLVRIRELVEQSNWILSSALSLAGPSTAAPQLIALEELLTEAVSSLGSAPANVRLTLSGDLPLVRLDPREARELVNSLLMLFRTAAEGAGPVAVTTLARPEGGVLLEIQAPRCSRGIAGAGSELALESAQRIAALHGGTFVLETGGVDASGAQGGIRGRLMLP